VDERLLDYLRKTGFELREEYTIAFSMQSPVLTTGLFFVEA